MDNLNVFGKKEDREADPFEVFNTLPVAPTLNLFDDPDDKEKEKKEGEQEKESKEEKKEEGQGNVSLFGILAAKKVDGYVESKNKPTSGKESADDHTSFEQMQEAMSKELQARVDASLQELNTVTPEIRTEKQEEFNKQLQMEQAEVESINLFNGIQPPTAKQVEKESMDIPEKVDDREDKPVTPEKADDGKDAQSIPEKMDDRKDEPVTQDVDGEQITQEFERFNKTTDKVLRPVFNTVDKAASKFQNAALVSHFEKMPRGIVREFEVAWDEKAQEAMVMQCASNTTSFVMPSKVKGCIVRYVRPNLFKLSKGKLSSIKDRLLYGVKEQFVIEVTSLSLPQCLRKIPNGFLHSECHLKQLVIPTTVTTIEPRAFAEAQIGIIEFMGRPPVDVQHVYFSPNTYIYCHEQFKQYFAGLHNVYVLEDR